MNRLFTGMGAVALMVALITLLGAIQADEHVQDAERWADNWVSQTRTTEYQGTLVVNNGRSGVQAFDLWHQFRDGEERERLRRRDGPLMEVDRIGDELTCVHGPGADVPEDHALPGSPFAQLLHLVSEQLAAHYEVRQLDSERVAERDTRVYELRHKTNNDLHRHRLWLDQAHDVLVRYQVVDADDQLLSEARFTAIEFGSVEFPRGLADRFANAFWHQYQAAQVGQGNQSGVNWHASWMPEGFERQLEESRGDGGYQLWTDGVVKVSVMVDPVSPDQPLNTSQRQGADALVARVHGDWQVVIVGAVPASTAEQIASGLNWD